MTTTSVDTITLTIPNNTEYVGVVRLAVSGVAARMNFSLDDVENIKIAVSEACSNAVQYAYGTDSGLITVECTVHSDHLGISISDNGQGFDTTAPIKPKNFDDPNESDIGLGLGMTFIKCLMDDVRITSNKGTGTCVEMIKKVPKIEKEAAKATT